MVQQKYSVSNVCMQESFISLGFEMFCQKTSLAGLPGSWEACHLVQLASDKKLLGLCFIPDGQLNEGYSLLNCLCEYGVASEVRRHSNQVDRHSVKISSQPPPH